MRDLDYKALKQLDLDLSPQLNYAPPEPKRHWMEIVQDVIDLLGGWAGISITTGVYALLLAPWAPGWFGVVLILAGLAILQVSVVYWLKKE